MSKTIEGTEQIEMTAEDFKAIFGENEFLTKVNMNFEGSSFPLIVSVLGKDDNDKDRSFAFSVHKPEIIMDFGIMSDSVYMKVTSFGEIKMEVSA